MHASNFPSYRASQVLELIVAKVARKGKWEKKKNSKSSIEAQAKYGARIGTATTACPPDTIRLLIFAHEYE